MITKINVSQTGDTYIWYHNKGLEDLSIRITASSSEEHKKIAERSLALMQEEAEKVIAENKIWYGDYNGETSEELEQYFCENVRDVVRLSNIDDSQHLLGKLRRAYMDFGETDLEPEEAALHTLRVLVDEETDYGREELVDEVVSLINLYSSVSNWMRKPTLARLSCEINLLAYRSQDMPLDKRVRLIEDKKGEVRGMQQQYSMFTIGGETV